MQNNICSSCCFSYCEMDRLAKTRMRGCLSSFWTAQLYTFLFLIIIWFTSAASSLTLRVVATIPRVPSVTRELQGEPHSNVVGAWYLAKVSHLPRPQHATAKTQCWPWFQAVVLKWLKPLEDGGCMISRLAVEAMFALICRRKSILMPRKDRFKDILEWNKR